MKSFFQIREDKQDDIDRIKGSIERHQNARNAARTAVTNTKDAGDKLRHTVRAQNHQKAILRAQEKIANLQKDEAVKRWTEANEGMDFKVSVDGLPDMYMKGNSPGSVKAHLRKLFKQPSMIKDVERITKHDKKKVFRDKAAGKMDEEMKIDDGTSEANKHMRKMTPGQSVEEDAFTQKAVDGGKMKPPSKARLAAIAKQQADKKKADDDAIAKLRGDKTEDIDKLPSARLKYHAKTGMQHGRYTNKEIDAEHKRRKKVEPNYDSVKPNLEGKLTIGKIRKMAYKGAKAAGDVQAVRKGKVGQRIKRRIAGKIAGKLIGALTR